MRLPLTDARAWARFLTLCLVACGVENPAPPPIRIQPPPPPAWATALEEPVGRVWCAGCHAEEAAAWTGSHHDLALQVAGTATVLGAFDGREADGMGQHARFVTEGDQYFVETTGYDGAPGRFKVTYTFGISPIQQYLVWFPNGAVQTLPWLWDTRPAPEGQQWRALYPDETIPPGDVLHWAGPNQRWNHMCADCHGTGVRKGYDAAAGTYTTTWYDEDVACEACHGNGSRHMGWADAGAEGPDPGLPVKLGDDAHWEMDPTRGIATRVPARTEHVEVDTCGRCHSRRLTISEEPPTGQSLVATHRVAILDADLYEADGQIREEVYEWGSFVQSPMYAAGVTCSDCHDPHSGRLRGEGNAVCAQCHLPERFDTTEHTHHAQGALCIDCHMPPRTYMVVDERRDHSMRVPRPDLAVSMGVPEPCTGCHADRDAVWAAKAVKEWFPRGRSGSPHYADALFAGRSREADAPDRLGALAKDPSAPGIARATAVSLLQRYPSPALIAVLTVAAADADPLVRREAATAGNVLPPEDRVRIVGPLLDDPLLGVRLAAVESLMTVPRSALGARRAEDLGRVVVEARAFHALHADRPESWTALGDLDGALGDPASAEVAYRRALALDPDAVAPRVNLSDLMRATGRDAEGLALLKEGLARLPSDAGLHHAAGLALVRLGDRDGGLAELERAAVLDPTQTRYAYVFAVGLSSYGRVADAQRVAEAAYDRAPGDPDLLVFLAGLASARGDSDEAARWHERALRDAPWAFAPTSP